jgi:hypothetical protein
MKTKQYRFGQQTGFLIIKSKGSQYIMTSWLYLTICPVANDWQLPLLPHLISEFNPFNDIWEWRLNARQADEIEKIYCTITNQLFSSAYADQLSNIKGVTEVNSQLMNQSTDELQKSMPSWTTVTKRNTSQNSPVELSY